MTRLAVVSPHLDDAVLSAWLILAGAPNVLVITCFAGVPQGGAEGAWDARTKFTSATEALAARRREDTAALAMTRSDAVHLDLLDEQYRDGQEAPGDELTALLQTHLAEAEEVWLPAGLGRHADHLLTRDAALAATNRTDQRLRLYADLPYAGQPAWPAEVTGGARDRTRRYLLSALRRPTPTQEWRSTLADAGLDRRLGAPTVTRLNRLEFRSKIAAVRRYSSQLDALRCGPKHLLRERRIFGYEVHWPMG